MCKCGEGGVNMDKVLEYDAEDEDTENGEDSDEDFESSQGDEDEW